MQKYIEADVISSNTCVCVYCYMLLFRDIIPGKHLKALSIVLSCAVDKAMIIVLKKDIRTI